MSSRTYDQVTDKFLDLSIEKTNSAYMLFYERVDNKDSVACPSNAHNSSGHSAFLAATDISARSSNKSEYGSKIAKTDEKPATNSNGCDCEDIQSDQPNLKAQGGSVDGAGANDSTNLDQLSTATTATCKSSSCHQKDLSEELEKWIWQDNMSFIQDCSIFDHTYFK